MSKKLIVTALLGLALSTGAAFAKNPTVGGAAMFPNKNIIQNAVNSPINTTLVAAVKAAGLVETLSPRGRPYEIPRQPSLLPAVLAFLEHVLDGGFVDHQVGSTGAVQLDTGLVVPLDIAVDFLAVAQHHDHGGLGLHLLLVVKVFGVGLLRGSTLF